MTFSNLPNRSSSDDDELDQMLNAWVAHSGNTHNTQEPVSDLAADAHDFHRWADEVRRNDPAAKGPAAGTWNRVLRQSAQANPKGKNTMSTASVASAPQSAIVYDSRPYNQQGINRFVSAAASLLVVAAITIGGWFAVSQLPPGGGGDNRFAALQGTPEVAQSQTCDVEPLTVDEVMAIVENPASVAPLDYWGTPAPEDDDESVRLVGEGLSEAPTMSNVVPENLSQVPDETEFKDIQQAADAYYNCTFDGTVGQFMAVLHPELLQYYVLSNFPVYRDEQTVRTFVEDVIDLPARQVSPSFNALSENLWPEYQTTKSTPERSRVRVGQASGSINLLIDRVALVGLDTLDQDGNVIGETDWDATLLHGTDQENNGGVSLIVVYSDATDTWYYYGAWAPRG